MKRVLGIILLSLSLCSAATVFANGDVVDATGKITKEVGEAGTTVTADLAEIGVYWHFITCVHDDHECSHEASYHGYRYYSSVHDDITCRGHEHFACYGGHD